MVAEWTTKPNSTERARVFLARLLIVYGTDAPDQLRRVADELEQLALDPDDEWNEARRL